MKSQEPIAIALIAETARAELRRCHLLTFLRSEEPAWQSKHHPELASGSAAWIARLRDESEARIPKTKRTLKPRK